MVRLDGKCERTGSVPLSEAQQSTAREQMRQVGLRPTRQRVALAGLLFSGPDRHITAEQLHGEALAGGIRVSLATVYNALHQFTRAGLLRELVVDPSRSYFDTNVGHHHHFYFEGENRLQDFPGHEIEMDTLPEAPEGCEVSRVDVIVRLRAKVDGRTR
jgi:Fur family iron response transcriptional regulator